MSYCAACGRGEVKLSSLPFGVWLDNLMSDCQMSKDYVAKRVGDSRPGAAGMTARRVHALRHPERRGVQHVTERTVEMFGIALEGDPRLAARLYPELDL